MADRIMVMYAGQIVEVGNTEDVFTTPLHPYTVALLSAIPIPDPKTKRERIILQGEVPNLIDPPQGCRFHPRCPYAFEVCGWTGSEVLEPFCSLLTSGRYPELQHMPRIIRKETVTELSFEVEVHGKLSDDDMEAIRKAVQKERTEEGITALRAVDRIGLRSSDPISVIVVTLQPYKVPTLNLVRDQHFVSCHLYTEGGGGQGIPHSPEIGPSHTDGTT